MFIGLQRKQVDILYIGNLSLDNITIKESSFNAPGGAALYSALASTLFGAKVSITGFIGHDYPADTLQKISSYGIDACPVLLPDKNSTQFDLKYAANMKLSSMGVRSPLFDYFYKLEIPKLHARLINISTNPFLIQKDLIERIYVKKQSNVPMLSMQTHGSYLTGVDPEIFMDLLQYVDFFFASETDLKELFGHFSNLAEIIHLLLPQSKISTCVTCGEKALLVSHKRTPMITLELPHITPIDPTGAGDSFVGGYLASYLRTKDPIVAAMCGHIAAGMAISAVGPHGLFKLLDSSLQLKRGGKRH